MRWSLRARIEAALRQRDGILRSILGDRQNHEALRQSDVAIMSLEGDEEFVRILAGDVVRVLGEELADLGRRRSIELGHGNERADGVHDAGAIGEWLAGLLAAPTTLATFVGCTV